MTDAITGVVIGGAISALSTIGVNFGLHYWKRRAKSIALARSFRGAIKSLVTIVEIRRYPEHINGLIAAMADDQQPRVMKLKASRNYIEIYPKNVDRLGLLKGMLPELIPQFYTMTNSLLEDVDVLASGGRDKDNAAQLTDIYQEMLAILAAVRAIASDIIAEIDDCYGKSESRVPQADE